MDVTIQHPWFKRALGPFYPSRLFDQFFGEGLFEYDLLPFLSSTISPYYRQSLFRTVLDSGISEVRCRCPGPLLVKGVLGWSRAQLGIHYCPVPSSSNASASPSLIPIQQRLGRPTSLAVTTSHVAGKGAGGGGDLPGPDCSLFLPSAHDPYVVCNAPTTCWKPQEQPHQGKSCDKGKRPELAAPPWIFSFGVGVGCTALKLREEGFPCRGAGASVAGKSCGWDSLLASLIAKERPQGRLPPYPSDPQF